MNHAALIEEAGNYASRYAKKHRNKNIVFHTIDHTKSIVSVVTQLANHYRLNDDDLFVVIVAAWFRNLGLYAGLAADHEKQSVALATAYLGEKKVDRWIVEKVAACILATFAHGDPVTLPEQILCDANLFYLGSPDFPAHNKLLRKETERFTGVRIAATSWRRDMILLLEEHQYYTDFSRLLLDDQKTHNLESLRSKQLQKEMQRDQQRLAPVIASLKKEKPSLPGRGVETLFRITSGNNQRLSDMADNKAQILITVNSIILSAIISLVLRKLDENSVLTYPTFSLLLVSLATIVISIISTRPAIPGGRFSMTDIEEQKVNLLFFGNFYRMNLEDYTRGMQELISDSDFLYGTLIKDVYAQGVVLGRKYRLLRVSYTVFMFGLIISMLGYLVVFLL